MAFSRAIILVTLLVPISAQIELFLYTVDTCNGSNSGRWKWSGYPTELTPCQTGQASGTSFGSQSGKFACDGTAGAMIGTLYANTNCSGTAMKTFKFTAAEAQKLVTRQCASLTDAVVPLSGSSNATQLYMKMASFPKGSEAIAACTPSGNGNGATGNGNGANGTGNGNGANGNGNGASGNNSNSGNNGTSGNGTTATKKPATTAATSFPFSMAVMQLLSMIGLAKLWC